MAVIKREYLSIVKTKTFIVLTILMPVGMLLLFSLPFILAFTSSGTTTICILDESGLFINKIDGNSNLQFMFVQDDLDDLRKRLSIDYDAILHIPNFDLQYLGEFRLIANKQIGLTTISRIESQMQRIIEDERFEREGIDRDLINKLKAIVRIESIVITGDTEKTGNAAISLSVGYIMGFLMYMIIFMYGSMISTSVIDEKKNRIVEILVSSLRPFELMIGKIFGIAAVALTQLCIWVFCFLVFFYCFVIFVIPHVNAPDVTVATQMQEEMQSNSMVRTMINFAENPNDMLDIPLLFFSIFFYFTFGYLFYSTLFACLGSLTDDHTQSQSFMWPITVPIILSMFIMIHVVDNPHSPVAIWASIIPFSSPIVMLARIPFNIPMWQIWISILILVVSIVGSTWLSGKVYRTSILLYGKKLTWKDVWKFIKI